MWIYKHYKIYVITRRRVVRERDKDRIKIWFSRAMLNVIHGGGIEKV